MATAFTPLKTTNGRVFIVEGTPSFTRKPRLLSCGILGGISHSLGDVNSIKCPDPKVYGKFVTIGQTVDAEDDAESSLSSRMPLTRRTELISLARNKVPVTVFFHAGSTERADLFTRFKKGIILRLARFTNVEVDDLMSFDEDSEVNVSTDITFADWYEHVPVSYGSVATTLTTRPITSVYVHDRSDTSLPLEDRLLYFAGMAGDAGNAGEVLWSRDGATWTSVSYGGAAAAGNNVLVSVVDGYLVVFDYNTSGHWYISVEDLLAGLTTFTAVVNATPSRGIANDSEDTVYVGDNAGNIYKMDDPTVATSLLYASGNATNVQALSACGDLIIAGDSGNNIYVSTDGATFSSATAAAGAVTTVLVRPNGEMAYGDATGVMQYSTNNGTTWVNIGFTGSGTAANVVGFRNPTEEVLYFSHNGRLFQSVGGGAVGTFISVPTTGALPANGGFLDVASNIFNPSISILGGTISGTDGIIVIGSE